MDCKKDLKEVSDNKNDIKQDVKDDKERLEDTLWEMQCRIAILEEFIEYNFLERVKEFRDHKNKQFKKKLELEEEKKKLELDKFLGTITPKNSDEKK